MRRRRHKPVGRPEAIVAVLIVAFIPTLMAAFVLAVLIAAAIEGGSW